MRVIARQKSRRSSGITFGAGDQDCQGKSMYTGSAIFVDFDNVFTTLWSIDEGMAIRFASNPADWLAGLAALNADRPCRWLVARCYLNPMGKVHAPGERNDRLWFSRFRANFVQAGFEVIDCPPLTWGAKNAADIRMVIDVLDLLGHRTRFEEFVFVSGDSDFTPLLHRLRAEDRRTAIVSPGHLATAYASVAERVLGLDALETLLAPAIAAAPDQATKDAAATDASENERAFEQLIRQRYESAVKPLNLSTLSHEVLRTLPDAKSGDWFGKGTFRRALDALALPNVRFSNHHLWNAEKHDPPAASQTTATTLGDEDDLPPDPEEQN